MSLASSLESLRKIDVNDLDLNNIGSWPAAVKVIVCVLLTAAVLALGYNFHLRDLQTLRAADRGGPGAGLQLPSP